LVTTEHEGRQFLLLDNRPGSVMLHDPSPDGWRVAKVHEGEGREGRSAVDFRLNSAGAEKMAQLTAAHQGDALAIIVYGEVCSVPIIRSEIPGQGQITTGDPDDTAEIIKMLQEGLPAGR
jgi:preprotein translocase subunit SecD